LLPIMAVRTPATFIMPVDFDDLIGCATGVSLLHLISARFIEIGVGTSKLAALLA